MLCGLFSATCSVAVFLQKVSWPSFCKRPYHEFLQKGFKAEFPKQGFVVELPQKEFCGRVSARTFRGSVSAKGLWSRFCKKVW